MTIDALVPAGAFASGVATSLGPCTAGRFAGVAAVAGGSRGWTRALRIGAFVAGLCACFAVAGIAGGALAAFAAHSRVTYLVLAAAMVASGLHLLVRRCESSRCRDERAPCGLAALLGFGFATIVSPCCGPVAAAIASTAGAAGDVRWAAASLVAYALGHAAPLAVFATGLPAIERCFRRGAARDAWSTVGGAVTLALGIYYGALA